MAKWIMFREVQATGSTKRFEVINKEHGAPIGIIKWYGAFRKYSFFPNPNTVYEPQCLTDIASYLAELMLEYNLKRELKKISRV